MREDHFWSWASRVVLFGWGVKKGGKLYQGGKENIVELEVVVEVIVGHAGR